MKRFLVAVAFGLMAMASHAEATFDQIEGLIQQKNYAAAAAGLDQIIVNHPNSAKAFYAMAQAQAGLGNQEKAQKALNIATGLNPTLDFAPEGSVKKLKDAITPQTAKIEYIEESHTLRNILVTLLVLACAGGAVFFFIESKRQAEEQAELEAEELARAEAKVKRMQAERERQEAEAKEAEAKEAALKAHKNYGHERFDPENPDKLKTVKRMKEEAAKKQRLFLEAQARREAQARADAAEASARMYRTSAQTVAQPTTTVVNNSGNDMLTGVLIGNMLSGSHDHHSHDTTVIRETVREVPTPSRSTWDDTPAPSKSSSWDDTPSTPSRSSSWDDSSSSSSSSSWSSSSSSDSGSSWSSWDDS